MYDTFGQEKDETPPIGGKISSLTNDGEYRPIFPFPISAKSELIY